MKLKMTLISMDAASLFIRGTGNRKLKVTLISMHAPSSYGEGHVTPTTSHH